MKKRKAAKRLAALMILTALIFSNAAFGVVYADEPNTPSNQQEMNGTPANSDPTDPDPTDPDPTDPDPTDPDPTDPDPANPDPNNQDPNNQDPNNQDPNNQDPNNQDPNNQDPNNQDPNNQDPNNQDPNNQDPNNQNPVVHTEHEYEWTWIEGTETHSGHCTYDGCDEVIESEACNIETKLDGTDEVEYCTKCGHEYSRANAKPEIISFKSNVEPKNNVNGVNKYDSAVTFTANVSCDAKHGARVYLKGYDVSTNREIQLEMSRVGEQYENGSYDYEYAFNSSSVDVFIDSVYAEAVDYSELKSTYTYQCSITIGAVGLEKSKIFPYVTAVNSEGTRVWLYSQENGNSEDYWYSSAIEGHPDIITVTMAGLTVDPMEEVDFLADNTSVMNSVSVEPYPYREGPYLWSNLKAYWNGSEVIYDPGEPSPLFQMLGNYPAVHWYQNRYDYRTTATDGEHTYKITYKVLGKSYSSDITINVDNTLPDITSVKYNGSTTPTGSSDADEGYYHEDVEIEVTVTEANLVDEHELSDLKLVRNGGESVPLKFKSKDGDKYIFTATASSDGTYRVSGSVKDKAGNVTSVDEQKQFTIDKTAPEVKIEFNNTEAKNGKYYNAARVATVTLVDANFEADDKYSTINVTEKDGKAAVDGWAKAGDSSFTKQIHFEQDGTYSFTFSAKDKAGNSVTADPVQEFVIDTTVPVIDVSFDNTTAKNENYFNSARQATIDVKDASFDSSLVIVEKTGEGSLNALPGLSGFSDVDNNHSASMKFEADGKYAFRITCQDLAGNTAETYTSSTFVIDTVAPEVNITGVADMSANNGAVQPVVTSTDENIKPEDVVVTLTGANKGTVSSSASVRQGNGGYVVELPDLAHVKENDDLYILKATITDLAGNVTEKEIKYSVNRFGSVYVLGDGTLSMIDNYYVTNPQNVVVTEINVDELTYKEVSVTYDGSVRNLSNGKDYSTSDTVNKNSWHSISYTIKAANFRNDGLYSVSVFSEDKATNTQSNKSKDANIEFMVDSTAPSVIVSGVESDGVYEEDEHDFSVNATDTIGINGLTVYLNDKVLAEYTAEDLQKNGGTEVLTIPGKDDYQQLKIVCSDVAGNETKYSCNNILVSKKAETLIANDIIQKAEITDEDTATGNESSLPRPLVAILIVIGAAAVMCSGILLYTRKKINKK